MGERGDSAGEWDVFVGQASTVYTKVEKEVPSRSHTEAFRRAATSSERARGARPERTLESEGAQNHSLRSRKKSRL